MANEPLVPVRQLQSIYQEGVMKLVSHIYQLRESGRSDSAAKAAMSAALKELEHLQGDTDAWIEDNVPASYREGWDNAFKSTAYMTPEGFGSQIRYENFIVSNKRAIEQVAYAMQSNMDAAILQVGRQIDDIYRQKGLEATATRLITGETIRDTRKALARELLDQTGVPFFTDQSGRKWRLDNYATMVARTTTREATTMGTLVRARAGGYNLLQVSEHHPTCEICAPMGGLVFTMDSNDKRYPLWEDDLVPAHPNCLHVVYVYVDRYDPDAESTMKRSQAYNPDIDPRSEAEKKAYNDMQAGNIRLNNLRNQHSRYVARLGKDAPPIQTFSRIKNQGGERWQQLQQQYRAAGQGAKASLDNNSQINQL